MPIPPLSRRNQSWRKNQKKYYIKRSTPNRSRTPKYKRKGKYKLPSWLNKKNIILAAVAAVFICSLFGIGLVAWVSRGLPDPNRLIDRELAESTKIFDRAGETVLFEFHGDEKRTLVSLDEIPDYVKQATIAIEDKDFYKHKGFSVWAIFRTFVTNVLRGERAGASTLTQQFIKNAVLSTEKTYTRKIKELLLAYKLEQRFTKDQILQMYLNEIPYGSTAYGIEAASQRYFGKSVRDINLPEAVVLAAMPQAPTRYSPYGSNKDTLIARQHYILDLMVDQGYIIEPKAEAAKQYQLEFKPPTENIIAPHFVMYVKEILSEKYGEKMVEQGGLKIYTALDLYKQQIAEEVVSEHSEDNEEGYEATNAALISLDPKTGQILAMVGSRDYFNDEIDGQVNITTSSRQPGSSLKPLVYAASFLKGYTPDTVLYDVITNFSNNPSEPYEPHNYDSEERGPVTVRKALAGSLNIPAVKAIYLAGVDNVLDLAQEIGYTTLGDRDRFGLSLVLGGGEVKLLEHANAYAAFAREGIWHPAAAILKVEDRDGNLLEKFELDEKKVLDPKIARQINNILSDNAARAYAFGERNWLTLGSRPVAAKTGTTNNYRDAWTLGYTPSLVAGVWVGNNDNTEMKRGAAGGTVAAPIWHDYMDRTLGDTPAETFHEPEKIETGKPVLDGQLTGEKLIKIDKASGLLATEYTPASQIEEVAYRDDHSILYYVDKNDPRGEIPAKPENDPQFELWESRVLAWSEEQGFSSSTPPTELDNLHRPENIPIFTITEPGNNHTLNNPLLTARIEATAPRGINRAEYYVDNNLVAINRSYPFNLGKMVSFLDNGYHELKVRVCDDVDNCGEKTIEINLSLGDLLGNRDFNLSWSTPSGDIAITSLDFPLSLEFDIYNPHNIAKINIFYINETGNSHQLDSIAPVETSRLSSQWLSSPPSGNYKMFAEAVSWSKNSKKTSAITINVNNLSENMAEDKTSSD